MIWNFYDLFNFCHGKKVLMKSIVFIIWLLTHGLVQAVQGKIVLGKNYVTDVHEVMAPEDGKHDLQNMFSEKC